MARIRPVLGWLILALWACGDEPEGNAPVVASEGECVDLDGDGFGSHCSAGPDCDDRSPDIHTGCTDCAAPSAGCACEPGTAPASCYLDVTREDGDLMCHEGTRYCREGVWSQCEDIFSYVLPEARRAAALVDIDAGPVSCNACNPVCYRVTDPLDLVDGGLVGADDQLEWSPSGGLTLREDPSQTTDAPPPTDPATCQVGSPPDADCDGIPDGFDPYPSTPPFASTNPGLFLEMGPGETDSGDIKVEFSLNSADVYFLVDQSGSMEGERDQLVADLGSGDFIGDPAYECSDIDGDGTPNNELKSGGIIGAIRCIIRDSNFGVGLFRELPFSGYAPSNQLVFEHYQDITADGDAVRAGANRLWLEGNNEWPEAGAIALHSLITGQGMYLGTHLPGVPSRNNCPAGRWGYACFRETAVPIVMLFTDAMLHNGPPSLEQPQRNAYPYPTTFTIRAAAATGDHDYRVIGGDNESFDSAFDLGNVTGRLLTAQGNTVGMNSQLSQSRLSCTSSSDNAPDAAVRFAVSKTTSISLSTDGSRFDTVLGLYQYQQPSLQILSASNNTNETAASARSFGAVNGAQKRITGSTASMQANYLGSALGCSADAAAPDAVYSFSATANTSVTLSTAGSGFDTVIALYDRPPLTTTFAVNPDNANDQLATAMDLGDVYNGVSAVAGSSSGAYGDYSAAELGCGGSDAAADVVYGFSLSRPTRVQVSTEGSTVDTRLALLAAECSSSPCDLLGEAQAEVPTGAEDLGRAFDIGRITGRRVRLSGDTSSMDEDLTSLGCGAPGAADAVVTFELSAPTDLSLDTTGSAFDAVVALYDGDPSGMVELAADNAHETTGNPQDLGTLNGKRMVVTGGDTEGMRSDYGAGQLSCAPDTAGSGDAVYRFHLDAATTVRLDTAGSEFDTVMSLHDAAIALPSPLTVSVAPSTSERPGSAHRHPASLSSGFHRVDGDLSAMRPDVTFHASSSNACHQGSDDQGRDAMFRLDVTQAGTYQLSLQSASATGLALYPANIAPYSVPLINYGTAGTGITPNAIDLGKLDDWWVRATGSTSADLYSLGSCSTSGGAYETIFDFSLDQSQSLIINSNGTAFDSALYQYQYTNAAHTGVVYNRCDASSGSGDDARFNSTVSAGDYVLALTGTNWHEGGTYRLEIKDNSLGANNLIACASGGTATTMQRYLAAGSYYAVVKGYRASATGTFSLEMSVAGAVFDPGAPHEVACSDDGPGLGSGSLIERTLPAGDYYVVVSGKNASAEGAYQLTLQDVDQPSVSGEVACSASGSLSLSDVPAGRYWAVLKGDGSSASGAFTLRVADDAAALSGSRLACDEDSADGRAALIERDLPAGDYHVVVKGQTVADAGAYRVAVRDISNQFVAPLACDADGGTGDTSFLQADVRAGQTYYVVVKGDAATDAGNHSLTITDTAAGTTPNMLACDNDSGAGTASALTRTLDPGVYYAAVKGRQTSNAGYFQLTVGGAAERDDTFKPPTWNDTEAALLGRGVKVIPILSCHDDPYYGDGQECDQARAQARQLANVTETLGPNLSPLVFDIDSNGDGLSNNVVQGIVNLSNYLEMDVKVVFGWEPDANPGFVATARAIDEAGDGCTGVKNGEEHLACRPGATPKFEITFENPASAPVRHNPSDPNGGYNFKALLIGDGSFIIDQVPIYVIPEDVEPDDGDPVYYPSGIYRQDLTSSGCTGNQRPDWRDLTWSGQVPRNTQINFMACAAETTAGLNSCTLKPVAQVRGEGYCIADADCSLGSCDRSVSACQIISGGVCTSDSECASNASCLAGRCIYSGQPVYVGQELGADNYQSYLRLGIQLTGDPPILQPPVLSGWDLTYLCGDVN